MPRTDSLTAAATATATDSGAQLRALYEAQGGVGQIFSGKVADYVASRPGYPPALLDALTSLGALPASSDIGDLGAGTGLLTRELLARGHRVVAIEPNADMRRAADALLCHHAGYRSQDGTAEATGLADASVDLLTAAQAFHWFDIEPARRESLRVLKPRGQVALVWNDRVLDDPLHAALDAVFAEFGGERRGALLTHEDRSQVPRFFGQAPLQQHFEHTQQLDRDGLLSLAFSRSYMPARTAAAGAQAAAAIGAVFDRLSAQDRIAVRYRAVLMMGRPTA